MKKKIKRFVPTLFVVLLFASMVVYAEESYSFYLSPGETRYTELVEKTNQATYATVVKGGLSISYTYARYTVVNNANYTKSETVKAYGVTTVQLSYSGYNVQKGDFIKLKVVNNTNDNSGSFLTVTGSWSP